MPGIDSSKHLQLIVVLQLVQRIEKIDMIHHPAMSCTVVQDYCSTDPPISALSQCDEAV